MQRALIVAVLSSAGCFSVGEGRGSLQGSLFVRHCTRDEDLGSLGVPAIYDMKPTYFVADPVDDFRSLRPTNKLAIRLQPTGNRVEEADVLYINIAKVWDVGVMVGQPIEVGPATNLRASLDMNATCPVREVQQELNGTITFTRFGNAETGAVPEADFRVQFGDDLTASFVFDVIDRRSLTLGGIGPVATEPAAGGHIEGNFDFVVRQGRAAQSL